MCAKQSWRAIDVGRYYERTGGVLIGIALPGLTAVSHDQIGNGEDSRRQTLPEPVQNDVAAIRSIDCVDAETV